MEREIKLPAPNAFVVLISNKYFIDTRIDIVYEDENGRTAGCAFLKWLDDSNEYGKGEARKLTIRASQLDNDEKKVVRDMIEEFYDSLNHSEKILKHLEENARFFKKRIECEKKAEEESKGVTSENPEDDF